MKKKLFAAGLVGAIIGIFLSISFTVFFFNLDKKSAFNIGRMFGAMKFIEMNYVNEVDKSKLLEGAIEGMVHSLNDPHSLYMDTKLYSRLKAETSGSFGGIGVYMGFRNNGVQVLSVMPDSPGAKAGLAAGDSILAVDGEPVADIAPDEVALKIRGDVGSDVNLLIKREGEADKNYTITRDVINIKTVFGTMLDDGSAYVRITNFSENTGKEFKEVLSEENFANIKGMILDLRQNPGGTITSCVEVAGEIVPAGDIVSVVERDGKKEVFKSGLENPKYPIVVLMDKYSASASELLAGALQDTGAAVIVGETSYGKGSVQTVVPMFADDALKLTIAKYYTPSGRSIDGTGIVPDFEVKLEKPVMIERELQTKNPPDAQLLKAEEILKNQIQAGKILFDK